MTRIASLGRTAALRITATYLAVFIGVVLILGGAAYLVASGIWRADIQDLVEREIRELTRDHGDSALARPTISRIDNSH